MKKIFLTVIAALVLILPSVSWADGGIFPYYPYWASEVAQKAVIVQDGNIETMIISMNFNGNANDFSWVLPTPSQPQVSKAPSNLVTSIESFVSEHQYLKVLPPLPATNGTGAEQGVNVIERKNIDIYDISVLQATNQNDLYSWLTANGYHYPSAGKYVLDNYISNGWYFTAIKVNAESITVAQDQLKYGTASPLKLVFNAINLVYPLKISGLVVGQSGDLSSDNIAMPIDLYVFADSEKQAIGFSKQWVGRLEPDVVRSFAYDSNGNPWYSPTKSKVLTALSASIAPVDMKDDVFLKDNTSAAPAPIAYDYSIVSQSAYPTISKGGGSSIVTLSLLNTGYEVWNESSDNPIRLGTTHANDRASSFYTPGDGLWLSPNRIRLVNGSVEPGQQAEFQFEVSTSSLKNGTYKEYFTPVVENKMWMKDVGIYWNVTVAPTTYSAQYISQSPFPTVKKGETADLWVIYKNTGSATWWDGSNSTLDRSSGHTVNLGTSNSLDCISIFYNSGDHWLSGNRVGPIYRNMSDGPINIPPGEEGQFRFTIRTPDAIGIYREYFRPVVDGVKWLDDVGLYWDITVTE